MKVYITDEMWQKLENILMECEVPYSVSFDSHYSGGDSDTAIYDKDITIHPITIQKEVKVCQ